jgi:hypothetical protein
MRDINLALDGVYHDANGRTPPRPNDRDHFAVKFAEADPALLAASRRRRRKDRAAVEQSTTVEKIELAGIQDRKPLSVLRAFMESRKRVSR